MPVAPWNAIAFNQDPESDNRIHGDELARQYGFEGGLVPGVTISAYLAHPAVQAWGEDFLDHGCAHVKVLSPLYDGEPFRVEIQDQTPSSYRARLLRAEDTVSAEATVWLEPGPPSAPERRGDPVAGKDYTPPLSSTATWRKLRDEGCKAFRYRWGGPHLMRSYLKDAADMPTLLAGDGACANMSYILGISNWVAAGNAHMNPWVHLETRSRNYRAIAPGTDIVAEMQVTDLFERKGHEFFDADVALYDARDDGCLAAISLRAIYHLRGS